MSVDSNLLDAPSVQVPVSPASATPLTDPVVKVARALGDPTRYRLLQRIAARGEVSCQELTAFADLAQGTISHHLKILAEAGLVSVRVEGPFHYYRARTGALAAHGKALAAAFPGGPPRQRSRARKPSPRNP